MPPGLLSSRHTGAAGHHELFRCKALRLRPEEPADLYLHIHTGTRSVGFPLFQR